MTPTHYSTTRCEVNRVCRSGLRHAAVFDFVEETLGPVAIFVAVLSCGIARLRGGEVGRTAKSSVNAIMARIALLSWAAPAQRLQPGDTASSRPSRKRKRHNTWTRATRPQTILPSHHREPDLRPARCLFRPKKCRYRRSAKHVRFSQSSLDCFRDSGRPGSVASVRTKECNSANLEA